MTRPECNLTNRPKETMTYWTVLREVNATLLRLGLQSQARAFRIQAVAVYEATRPDEDNLADLYDIVSQYVEVR